MKTIDKFCSKHGWVNYELFNEWMSNNGFEVTELERHNQTDGEVHFKYTHKQTRFEYELNGNRWDKQSFEAVSEWIELRVGHPKEYKLTHYELYTLLKEAYRNGYSAYEMIDAGLESYDADGYARWVVHGLDSKEFKNEFYKK